MRINIYGYIYFPLCSPGQAPGPVRDAVSVGVAAVLAAPQRGVGLGGHGEGRAPVGGVVPGRAPPRRGEAGHGGAAAGHLHTRHPATPD